MKNVKSILLTSALVLLMSSSVLAVENVNVSINGVSVNFDVKPYVDENGRTLVPISKIAGIFNATTNWDSANNTVTIKDNTTTIKLKIGENEINVNNVDVQMDTKAVIKEGRTFVPISAIAKAFNVGYTWNGTTNTVDIKAGDNVKVETEEYSVQDYSIVNRSAGNNFALDGEYLYYSNPNNKRYLYKKNITTGENVKVFDKGEWIHDIYLTDDYIIFQYMDLNTHKNVLARLDKKSKDIKIFGSTPVNIQVANDRIYYTSDEGGRKLYSMNFDFEDQKMIIDNLNVFIVNENVVIFDSMNKMYTSSLDGTDKKEISINGNLDDLSLINVDLETSNIYPVQFQKYNQLDVINESGELQTYKLNNAIQYGYITVLDDVVYYNTANVGISSYDINTGKETLIIKENFDNPHLIGDYIYAISGNKVVTYNLATRVKSELK